MGQVEKRGCLEGGSDYVAFSVSHRGPERVSRVARDEERVGETTKLRGGRAR